MDNTCLTKMQAYMAMYYFLENLYELTNDGSLGGFLGSMRLLKDDLPADSAYQEDWEKAVRKALDFIKNSS